MPSKSSHLAAARSNQRTVDYLAIHIEDHLPWVVVVAFYKALHLVEAVFAGDPQAPKNHTDDHGARNLLLRKHRRYEHLWKHYKPLYDLALIARYLREDENAPTYEVFSRYMNAEAVRKLVLNHYLRQIEVGAGRLLGEPNLLDAPANPNEDGPSG